MQTTMSVKCLDKHPEGCICNKCERRVMRKAGRAYYQFIDAVSVEEIGEYQREFYALWNMVDGHSFRKEKN